MRTTHAFTHVFQNFLRSRNVINWRKDKNPELSQNSAGGNFTFCCHQESYSRSTSPKSSLIQFRISAFVGFLTLWVFSRNGIKGRRGKGWNDFHSKAFPLQTFPRDITNSFSYCRSNIEKLFSRERGVSVRKINIKFT